MWARRCFILWTPWTRRIHKWGWAWNSFIGYTVTDVQKGYLGEITDVDETTINVLLRVDHKGEELLIPAVEELITEADRARSLYVIVFAGGTYRIDN